MLGEIKTCRISNGALKSDTLPTRLKIFNWGDNDSTDGIFRAGNRTASELPGNQKTLGFERVAIDFNHCTVAGTETYKELLKNGQPPLIFGYGRPNVVPGEGVFLEDCTWTPLGVQHAKNFEDISPAPRTSKDNNEVLMIHSVALTPNGKVTDLRFFSATENQIPMKPEDYLSISELAPAIGLKTDAPKTEILSRLGLLAVLSSSVALANGKITAMFGADVKDGKLALLSVEPRLAKVEEAATGGLTLLSAEIDGVKKNFTAEDLVKVLTRVDMLETKVVEDECAKLVKLFAADGKVPKNADGKAYTAEELKKLDVGTLQLLHANTPSTVPISQRHATGQTEGAAKKYRGADGKVNLSAIFDDENERSGQAHPAHALGS